MKQKRRSPHRFTPEDEAYIRRVYPVTPADEVANTLGVTVGQIYSFARRRGIAKHDGHRSPITVPRCPELDAVLFAEYELGNASEIAARFGIPINHVYNRANYLSIRKITKRSSLPVGTIRWRGYNEKTGAQGYMEKKIAMPNKWRYVHELVWEERHGCSVIPGHTIMFIDGDHGNLNPDNLICLSRGERYATMGHKVSPLMVGVCAAARKLKNAIKELGKKKK